MFRTLGLDEFGFGVPSGHPSVAVIVSHYNSSRTILRCIEHLLKQEYPRELIKIVIVDGGSTDGSVEMVKSTKDERLFQIVEQGCSEAEGQMIGIQDSRSEVIMLTNSDVYVPRDWVRKHVEWLSKGYDIIGGKVFWGGDKFAFAWNTPTPSQPRFVQTQGMGLGFSNCSFRRSLLATVGGISDMKSQHDTEFAFRVVMKGGKMLLDPEIEVYHDHPMRSFRLSFMRSFGYGMNHVLVMRARYGRIVTGSGAPAMMPITSLLKEWTSLNGVKTYKELYRRALATGIRVGLLEFLFIRLFSTRLGLMLGVLVGATKRKVAIDSVANLHRQRSQYVRFR